MHELAIRVLGERQQVLALQVDELRRAGKDQWEKEDNLRRALAVRVQMATLAESMRVLEKAQGEGTKAGGAEGGRAGGPSHGEVDHA